MKKFSAILLLLLTGTLFLEAQNLISQQHENGKYGFVNEAGEFIIQPKYEDVGIEFTDGVACVKQKGKFIFIDGNGKEVSKKSYTWVNYFDENGLCMVNNGGKVNENDEVRGGKFGYVDRTGKEVIPLKYSLIEPFNSNGIACVNVGGSYNKEGDFTGGKYGFINIHGKELISPKYTRVGNFDNTGIAWINIGGKDNAKTGEFEGGKFGYVNDQGIEIVAPKYSFIGPFIDGICWVNNGGKVFYRESDKKLKKKMQSYEKTRKDAEKLLNTANLFRKNKPKQNMQAASDTEAGQYRTVAREDAELGHKYKLLDETLIEIKDQNQRTKAYREGLISEFTGGKRDVRQSEVTGGKFGFVDIHGREIAKPKYTQTANYFTEDRAWVQMGKKFGYVDNSGREITKIKYDLVADEYHNRSASVFFKQRYGLINYTGQEITEIKYLNVGKFDSGFTWVKRLPEKKGKTTVPAKYAFVNELGKLITDFKYDLVHPEISEGLVGGLTNGEWCIVNDKGEEIVKNLLEVTPFDGGVAWVKRNPLMESTVSEGTHVFQSTIDLIATTEVRNLKQKIPSLRELNESTLKMLYKSVNVSPTIGYYGLIDREGNNITEFRFTSVGGFSEDLAYVKTLVEPGVHDGLVGYVNRKGEEVVPCKYILGYPFKEGFAAVKSKEGKWGYVNKEGTEVVPCLYNSVTKSFKDGIAGVKVEDYWGGVNTSGEIIIPPYLSFPADVMSIAEKYDLSNNTIPLTIRQVTLYNIYQKNTRKHYPITTVIPDDMWDF